MKRIVSALIALAMVLSVFPAVYAEELDLTKGLIAYYDFENDGERPSVITDKSGMGNDAEVLNTVRQGNGWWDPGAERILTIENGIANFPGNKAYWGGGDMGAALRLPNGFNQGIKDFTYSAWIKADSSYEENSGMTRFFDFGNISGGNARDSIFVRHTPATGLLRIQDRGIAKSSDDEASLAENTFDYLPFTDAWGLLTVTFEYDGAKYYKVKLYINDSPVFWIDYKFTRSLDDLGVLDDSSNGLFIGRTVWGATNQEAQQNPDFCGQMDDIRIYNRAITPEEVNVLYETTSPVGKITMASYEEQTVATMAGDYPILPDTVKVTYTSGEVKEESVTWETLTSDMYSSAGTVIVKGVTENDHNVTVKLVVASKADGTLSEGLVVCYNFDADGEEPGEITDVSGNGRNGIVYNMSEQVQSWGETKTIESKLTVKDKVAYFPGHKTGADLGLGGRESRNTYSGAAIKLPNGTNEGIADFTYSAWIYADTSYRYKDARQRFFDFGKNDGSSKNSIFFRYTASSGDSRFQDRRVAASSDDDESFVSATLSDLPFNDKWGMLTVTYRKTEAGYYEPKVYINGVERQEYEKDTNWLRKSLFDLGVLDDSTNGLWIGRTQWNNTDNPDFCGKMDEIRLYNRALSDSEVMELYTKKKPSDMPIDYENMPKTEITAAEDVTISERWPDDEKLKWNADIMASHKDYDGNRRYVLMRFNMAESELKKAKQSARTVIRTYCTELSGGGEYYIYALTGENNAWNIDTVTYNTFTDETGLTVDDSGKPSGGVLVKTMTLDSSAQGGYIDWDITDFVQTTGETEFSFLITAGNGGLKMKSADTDDVPKMIIYQEGTPINVKKVTEAGDVISTAVVYAVEGQSYVYNVSDKVTAYNGEIYVFDEAKSTLSVESVEEGSEITVCYKKAAEVQTETAEAVTCVGKAPTLPKVITVTADGESAAFGVSWNEISAESYAQKGEFEAEGSVINTSLTAKATVKVFPNRNGAPGCDLTIYAYLDGVLDKEVAIDRAYGSTFTLDEGYSKIDELHELQKIEGDVSAIGDTLLLNELGQHIELYYVTKEKIEADFSARVKAEDMENTVYTIRAEANVLNTEKKDVTVCLGIANYDEEGKLTSCNIKKTLVQSRTGETVKIEEKIPYTEESKRMKLYLWDENLRPLADAISVGELKVEQYFDEEVIRMTPTYDNAVSAVRKANDYWQSNYSYDTWTSGIHPAFWSRAAYHTGNIEAYKLLGDENYLKHSVDWANYNKWMGNDNTTAEKDQWTWGYNQTQGSNAVLFGDWQICFQSYLDMAELGVEDANLDRVFEVMDYQISKEEDGFWWWADSLYMVMPVMSKLYKRTGDEKYLDALYKYFRYAKELMYDGPGGIPTDKDGYTTSASLKNGASYSNPDDYKYLFYRDANYCFPLNAISGHANEKNFWARGDGWVFAGLAKVLTDMPETYEHYNEFKTTYLEMAKAIIACQKVDSEGHGFWTQSMLLDYPKGNNGNDEGYETSGTAFFTYGLFWGINNGLLDEATYLEPAIRGYGYLDEVALLSDGKVGYVQPIGSNATQATPEGTTQDFGVGAFLLANCEAARWAQNTNK